MVSTAAAGARRSQVNERKHAMQTSFGQEISHAALALNLTCQQQLTDSIIRTMNGSVSPNKS